MREFYLHSERFHSLLYVSKHDLADSLDIRISKLIEDDDLIDSIEKFRLEGVLQGARHGGFYLRVFPTRVI